MQSEAMILHGKSLFDYYNGDRAAEIILRRDDGFETVLPISVFFRSEAEFFPGEIEAINLCKGFVLDIGAGSGIHSLLLQSRGLKVTAIDIDPRTLQKLAAIKNWESEIVYQGDDGEYLARLILKSSV